mmetsp:Transcript_38158/g.90148  ORF Transcript_38158/g.90148 Transcript_38158/m.90148 type:complete len:216 (-) Transcript_38158:140-787(-)
MRWVCLRASLRTRVPLASQPPAASTTPSSSAMSTSAAHRPSPPPCATSTSLSPTWTPPLPGSRVRPQRTTTMASVCARSKTLSRSTGLPKRPQGWGRTERGKVSRGRRQRKISRSKWRYQREQRQRKSKSVSSRRKSSSLAPTPTRSPSNSTPKSTPRKARGRSRSKHSASWSTSPRRVSGRESTDPTLRNHIQEHAFLVQSVRRLWFLVFDFAI